jgi:hypothetical protein
MTADQLEDLQRREEALNETLRRGRLLTAYTTFYLATSQGGAADDRTRVLHFLQWADTFVGRVPVRNAVSDDRSYSQWEIPVSGGPPGSGTQLVTRRWRDGKVVQEWAIVRRELGKTA